MPNTGNVGLEVPVTGSLPGTWGSAALNPNFLAIDGLVSGAQTISVSNANVTLTAPPVSITPSPGPFQSQNRILKFTGAVTGGIIITLPLPGKYQVVNQTTGTGTMQFHAPGGATYVSTPQGSYMEIFNDGVDCWLGRNTAPGQLVFLAGLNAVPAWVNGNTVPPLLLCDGGIYNVATFPAAGAILGAKFGGNGITTFGVPDLRGRVPLAYDGTGARITLAGGAGFNGQVIGAAGGAQGNNLVLANLPPYTPTGGVSSSFSGSGAVGLFAGVSGQLGNDYPAIVAGGSTFVAVSGTVSSFFGGNPQGGVSSTFSNVLPAQVTGIWMIAT